MRNTILTAMVALALVACGGAGADGQADAVPTATLDSVPVGGGDVAATGTTGTETGSHAGAGAESGTIPGGGADTGGDTGPGAGAGTAADVPGPKPAGTCSVTKDANGFFTRNGYVGYVPPTYDGSKAVRLLVGLHGCGDNAHNFATWAVAPWDTRKTQEHIAISIGGRDGQCWQNGDESAVLAAIADISSCYWVHQQEVVIAGFSSGGELGYRIAMKHADAIAGLVVEDSGFYGSSDEAALLAAASRKLPVAHIAHQSDTVFPLATVQADWTRIKNAGFPMTTSVVAGAHDGTSADWNSFLIPQAATMKLP